ncbi:protein NEDD1 isoform X1 [Magnolia sinica]|uniref:protein NEDD1 isoform X1 n=1 Tax=Magnolia sinica TaxID=86752 RepID=UPI00265841AE|nr:protein NEDD1 isoform X1 [Magnolia sinica]
MMNLMDPSTALLAACGGDTVKLFDVSEGTGSSDPCTLSYVPSPGFQVNSVKWNHTNLVVASAGDDKKISLWRKNGQSMGTVPTSGSDVGDNIDESILAISFSNKGSRYLCSGGSSQIVRVWDLQRKRCIKWLKGHTDTVTGVMYNCKDEHLASISLKGDLILHNLASGTRAAELKDPNEQVLRVLDYSRISRHVLVTAGDNGSVHMWDTTGRSPKVSWLKQHSAPTTGVCFSPSNDKIIASVGLDKKLYTFDSGTRKSTSCIPYEAPFSSLAFRDDGWTLAAGTSSGRIVFYDVRGKPQPLTVLRAYSSEAITSLCWQRSKPIIVNESTCTAEIALLGGTGEESILMPDPLPSLTSSSLSSATVLVGSRNSGRSVSVADASLLTTTSSGSISTTSYLSAVEETPHRNLLWKGGALSRLHAPRSNYNFNDDMEVFSPLVEVQPITPSLGTWWDEHEDAKNDHDRKPSSLFPSSARRFPYTEEGSMDPHPISHWKSNSTSKQDDTPSTLSLPSSMPITPPEAWGGDGLSDKLSHLRPAVPKQSRFMTSGLLTSGASSSVFTGLQDSSASTSHTSISSLTHTITSSTSLHGKDISNHETLSGFPFSSTSSPFGTKTIAGQANLEFPGSIQLALPRKYSSYAERMSTVSSSGDGASHVIGSPKLKKTGAEIREELVNSFSRSDTSATVSRLLPTTNGAVLQPQTQKSLAQTEQQQGTSSFMLQLVQRTLEETLTSVQKSIHEDMRNLHIELLRQFHMQETEMSSLMTSVLEKQAELMKEVQSLRKENQQLRQLL